MEDELWRSLYQLLLQESKHRLRRSGVWFTDLMILGVFFWAVLHDRPVSWACRRKSWPAQMPWDSLPSAATMSRRLRSVSVICLLKAMLDALAATTTPSLLHSVDAKPLVVGGFSKDHDAKWGYAVDAKARGYKLFAIWSQTSPVPDCWDLGPMNRSEPVVAEQLVGRLDSSGYLLGDSAYDTNPLHQLWRITACNWCASQKAGYGTWTYRALPLPPAKHRIAGGASGNHRQRIPNLRAGSVCPPNVH